MVTTADQVVVDLIARTQRFDAQIRASATGFEQQMRRLENSSERQGRQFQRTIDRQAQQIRRLEDQVRNSGGAISSQFRNIAGSLAAAFSAQQVASLADSYTRFTNQLKVAGLEGEALGDVQERLFEIAQRNGVELEQLGNLYGRVAQSAGDLGANSSQLIALTEGVAAGLRVQGSSAAQASGAILGLVQALGSTTVKAEEFNQINEGAAPILRAVAQNIDGAGGSISRLRALVVDQQITNKEFFDAFLAGSAALQEQAARSNLTIANSFTVLNNALGKYIGEADQSLSATEQLSGAIIALSENLDVVAKVVGALSVLLIGRYAASLVAAAGATGATSAAIFALQARALGAATSMEALAFAGGAAGRSLLAAFGGPVGLAVAVLSTGILLLATRTTEAERAAEALARGQERGAAASKAAADAAERLASAHGKSRAEALAAAKQEQKLTLEKLRGAQASLQLARAELVRVRAEAGENLKRESRNLRGAGSGFDPAFGAALRGTAAIEKAETKVLEAAGQLQGITKTLEQLNSAISAAQAPIEVVASEDEKKTRRERARREPTGPTAAEIEDRFSGDLARLRAEQLQAEIDLATDAQDRADLQQSLLQLERAERIKQIENDKEFTRAQKDAQIAAINRLFGTTTQSTGPDGEIIVTRDRERGLLERRIERDLAQEQLRQRQELLRLEQDAIEAQAGITLSLETRFQLEDRALDLQQQIERELLEQAIINGEITDAARARALLEQRQAVEREDLNRSQQSPLDQLRTDLTEQSQNLNVALENIGVEAIENINAGLVDAIVNFRSLGDVGRSVLQSLTASLVRLALQQLTLKLIGQSAGSAAVSATGVQASAAAAAWAPAAALASLATLGSNAGPAALALSATTALSQALAATGGLKDGGPVTGPGGPRDDKVLTRLSAGEYVINASATRALGRQALDFMNATGQLPGMRAGGGQAVPSLRIPNGSARPAGGGFGPAGIDERSLSRLAQVVSEATKAMPPVQLFPTLDPAKALIAGLNSPGGSRAFFDFVNQNAGQFQSAINR